MSKKKFVAPIAEIIYLSPTDVLTTSTGAFDGEWVPLDFSNNDDALI